MRLLGNYAKLGLALLTLAVLLCAATAADADQVHGAVANPIAAVDPVSGTVTSTGDSAQPPGAANSTGGAPVETTGTSNPSSQTPPSNGTATTTTGTSNPSSQTPPSNGTATTTSGTNPSSQTAPPIGPPTTVSNPAQTVTPDGPTSNDPVQQAAAQAVNDYQVQAGTNAPSSGTGASSATSQKIWQVQISGCTAHCQGMSQTQAALQQSTTVQVPGGSPEAAPGAGTPVGAGDASQPSGTITQIQLGCLSHCFGITTTSTAISGGIEQTLEQLLSGLMSGLSSPNPPSATQRSVTDQSTYQWQEGAPSQTQLASQTSTTVQVAYPGSSLTAALGSALSPSNATPVGAINQTEQGIWQLQVGCLVFCTDTQQNQDAQQSNQTINVASPEDPGNETAAAVVNLGKQLIWQLQIGCIFWCYDATEHQGASSRNTLQLIPGSSSGAGAPPPPGPGSGAPQKPPPIQAAVGSAGSGPGSGPGSTVAVPGASSSAAASTTSGSPMPVLESSPGALRRQTPSSAKQRNATAPSGPDSSALLNKVPLPSGPASSMKTPGAAPTEATRSATSSIVTTLPAPLARAATLLMLTPTRHSGKAPVAAGRVETRSRIAAGRIVARFRLTKLSPVPSAILTDRATAESSGGIAPTVAFAGAIAIFLCVSSAIAMRRIRGPHDGTAES